MGVFRSIAAHGPFLLFVLPLVGALLVRLSRRFGEETVRRTAYSNVALSIVIALNLLAHFEPESPANVRRGDGFRFQSASQASVELKPRGQESVHGATRRRRGDVTIESSQPERTQPPLLRIAVGVDGFSIWFVLLIPLAMLPAVDSAGRGEQAAGRLVELLLLESLLLGAFAALDAIFFVICLELVGVLLLLMAGRWSAPPQRREAIAACVMHLAGALSVGLALAGTIVAHQWTSAGEFAGFQPLTFALDRLTGDLPPTDGEFGNPYWHALEPFVFVAFAIGFLMMSAASPMLCGRSEETGLPALFIAIPVYAIAPCLGVYGYLRFAASFGAWSAGHNAVTITTLIIIWGLYCGLMAATRKRFADAVKYAASAHVTIAFLSAAQLSRVGLTAALFHLITHIAAVSLLILLARQRPAVSPRSPERVLCVAALIGAPVSAGFVGNWWMLHGFAGRHAWFGAAASLLILLLCAGGLLFAEGAEPTEGEEPNRPFLFPAIALGFALVAFGVAPQFVIDRSAAMVKRVNIESRSQPGVRSEVRRD